MSHTLSSQTLIHQEFSQYGLRSGCSAKPQRILDTGFTRRTNALPTSSDADPMARDVVVEFNLDVDLGPALIVTCPAEIARDLRTGTPFPIGSDGDLAVNRLVSELESRLASEFVRLAEQTKLLEEDLGANLVKVEERVAAYTLERLRSEFLPYETRAEDQLGVVTRTKPSRLFSDYAEYPASYSGPSAHFKAELGDLITELERISQKDGSSDGNVFDICLQAMRDALSHCGRRSDAQARLSVLINRQLADYLPEIEILLKTIRTRKLAKQDQLKAHGVILFMEEYVFNRLDGYQIKLEELLRSPRALLSDSRSRRALKWRAAMRASAGLSQTFTSVFQRFSVAYGQTTSDVVQAQINSIPEVAALTYETMLDYAAEIGILRDNHSLKTYPGRPGEDYLLIEFPVVGLEGQDLLIGLCEFLNIHFAIEDGFEIVD